MSDTMPQPLGHSARDAAYKVMDGALALGSTLGGPKVTVSIKPTGAINQIYSIELGRTIFGSVTLRHFDRDTGLHLAAIPGSYFILGASDQERHSTLPEGIEVAERISCLSRGIDHGGVDDPLAVYYEVELRNSGATPRNLATYALAELYGDPDTLVQGRYDASLGALLAWPDDQPEHVSIFGCSEPLTSHSLTSDHALGTAQHLPGPLDNRIASHPYPLPVLHSTCRLAPGDTHALHYRMTCSGAGQKGATRTYRACRDVARARAQTSDHYSAVLGCARVMTPNPDVNRGAMWAKVNMLRTELCAPRGWGITNNPGHSNNAVGRDTAWFAMGADLITPRFAGEALLGFMRRQKPNGMLVEYYGLVNGDTEDFGFNINDNTPLLLLALWHHYNATGDENFLREVYPAAAKAARYILSQENAQGLVCCDATGTGSRGIVGWRNVIQGYRLSGATTEVNSECYAALSCIAHMARTCGEHDEADAFADQARELKHAIRDHLRNPENDLYYLSIDLDGTPRGDVTSDLVFPLLFGIAEGDEAVHIIRRLNDRDFWTRAGLRTVPRDAPNYSPTGGYGLMGGVWVACTYWYAYAVARFAPEYVDQALGASFQFYSSDPSRYNTVPGQFSEWLHGETLANQGMMLSPWFPPRYLWAAIEGAAGLDLLGATATLHHRLAPDWDWLGVQRVPYRGRALSWFTVRAPDLRLYTNLRLDGAGERKSPVVYDEDISDTVTTSHDAVSSMGLRRVSGEVLLFAGSTDDDALNTVLRVDQPNLAERYRVRAYDSLAGTWQDEPAIEGAALRRGIILDMERKGFRLLELHPD